MAEDAETLTFRPVTRARWPDFEALFSHKGAPSYCWCMAWRTTPEEAKEHSGARRKPMMKQRIMAGTPVGLVGYLKDEPVAWVSIAPRDTYRNLGGPEAEHSEKIWSLACMYIRRPLRGRGYGLTLIEAAKAYAKGRGGTVLEAYPVDPQSPSYRHMGLRARVRKTRLQAHRHGRLASPRDAPAALKCNATDPGALTAASKGPRNC